MYLYLLEKINPVNPISFRKQTFCNSRHKSLLPWKKSRLQIYHFVGTQRTMYWIRGFWVWLCSLSIEQIQWAPLKKTMMCKLIYLLWRCCLTTTVMNVYFGIYCYPESV